MIAFENPILKYFDVFIATIKVASITRQATSSKALEHRMADTMLEGVHVKLLMRLFCKDKKLV